MHRNFKTIKIGMARMIKMIKQVLVSLNVMADDENSIEFKFMQAVAAMAIYVGSKKLFKPDQMNLV